jgi:hypothetical protein
MKNLKNSMFCMMLILYSITLRAQFQQTIPLNEPDYNKEKLFADLPQKIACPTNILAPLFTMEKGSQVNLPFSDKFIFRGFIVTHSDYSNTMVRTIVIRSSNRAGAVLSLTMLMDKEAIVSYKGRIISMNNGDAFELIPEHGQYFFLKKNLYDLISE